MEPFEPFVKRKMEESRGWRIVDWQVEDAYRFFGSSLLDRWSFYLVAN